MPRRSAGLLLFRRARQDALEVLLVHPGGPFWRNRDAGAWTIPKGELDPGEDPRATALREFAEETGATLTGEPSPLGEITQKGGKLVTAFALEGDFDPVRLVSNMCEVEFPPRSGKRQLVPEVDRAEWFDLDTARTKINPAQIPFLERLAHAVPEIDPSHGGADEVKLS